MTFSFIDSLQQFPISKQSLFLMRPYEMRIFKGKPLKYHTTDHSDHIILIMQADSIPFVLRFTDEKQHTLTEQEFQAIPYFQEIEATNQGQTEIQMSLTSDEFMLVTNLLREFNYRLPETARRATSNNVMQHLGYHMTEYFGGLSTQELKLMLKAAKLLKVEALCKIIGVRFACMFRIDQRNPAQSVNEIKANLGIQAQVTAEKIQLLKKKYPFLQRN